MDSENAIKVVGAIRTAWPYQPMDEREQHAWTRALTDPMTHVSVDEARAARDRFVAAGGSQAANQRGRRPGVAEFVGAVTGERSKRGPSVRDTRTPDPWPEPTPEHVSEQVKACKSLIHQGGKR